MCIFLGFCLVLGSCASKKGYIDDFSAFIRDVELEQENFSAEEWAQVEVEFVEYSVTQFEVYEIELNDQEMRQVNKFMERYNAVQIKRRASGIFDSVKEGVEKVKDAIFSE